MQDACIERLVLLLNLFVASKSQARVANQNPKKLSMVPHNFLFRPSRVKMLGGSKKQATSPRQAATQQVFKDEVTLGVFRPERGFGMVNQSGWRGGGVSRFCWSHARIESSPNPPPRSCSPTSSLFCLGVLLMLMSTHALAQYIYRSPTNEGFIVDRVWTSL